jgi:hypothetical protein
VILFSKGEKEEEESERDEPAEKKMHSISFPREEGRTKLKEIIFNDCSVSIAPVLCCVPSSENEIEKREEEEEERERLFRRREGMMVKLDKRMISLSSSSSFLSIR